MTGQSQEFRSHWRALTGCTLAAATGTVGFHAYTSGAFVAPLTAAGYTRAQLSLATLFLSATIAVLAPLAGMMMDRYGAVRVITVSVIGEAAAFAILGATPVGFAAYAGGIVLLAALGVGTTPPGFARIITARFDRGRGLALGVMISGLGVMAVSAPVWATWLTAWGGWRAGYWTMAAMVVVFGGGGVLLIRSERSEHFSGGRDTRAAGASGSWEALRRPLFWALVAGFLAPALFGGGYLLHMITILRERGFSPTGAAGVQSLIGFAILVGRLTSGAAMDRYRAQHVAAVAFTISALGCALLLTSNPVLMGVAALAIGLTIGAELDIMAYLIGRYFGLGSFGRLYGLAYSGLVIAGGTSPVLIAWLAGIGGYPLALMVSTVGTLIGPAILLLMPAPRAEPEEEHRPDAPHGPHEAGVRA